LAKTSVSLSTVAIDHFSPMFEPVAPCATKQAMLLLDDHKEA